MRGFQFQVLPPIDPTVCRECGVKHEPKDPHDATRLQYQYTVYAREGRWATWDDALMHCDEETQTRWRDALRESGIDPASTKVSGDG